MFRTTHNGERLERDRGISAVLVALLVTVLLMFAAIAVDGGQAYAQRRVTQNAADSAAMAGTRVVQQIRFPVGGVTPPLVSEVRNAVVRALGENGAEASECYLIRNDAARTRVSGDFCGNASLLTSLTAVDLATNQVAGVEVIGKQTRETFFARVAGFDETTAKADAAATVQPMVRGGGSPFIVCGRSDLPDGDPDGYDILDANNQIKTTAIGQWFPLQYGSGSNFKRCGAGSDWKGKGAVGPIEIGTWYEGISGNGYNSDIEQTVAGLTVCEGEVLDGCGMILPIAEQGCRGGSCPPGIGGGGEDWFKIVAWTVWQVYGNGHGGGSTHPNCSNGALSPLFDDPSTPKYCGKLLGAYVSTGGAGGEGDPLAGQAQVIKLVD